MNLKWMGLSPFLSPLFPFWPNSVSSCIMGLFSTDLFSVCDESDMSSFFSTDVLDCQVHQWKRKGSARRVRFHRLVHQSVGLGVHFGAILNYPRAVPHGVFLAM